MKMYRLKQIICLNWDKWNGICCLFSVYYLMISFSQLKMSVCLIALFILKLNINWKFFDRVYLIIDLRCKVIQINY